MPTPDQLLETLKRQENRQLQGRLKIYLGMVAGVGKTYAMLKGAHQLKEQRTDVVVGYVETHGRLDTIAQIGDLEVLPRLKISHRDVELDEFDLDQALKRKPQVILVDELAHTNIPGSRHPKRYQDILELLGQGIDVHTTLNVQHLQSRADTVAKITGVIVQEIVPDSIIDRADDIILIDQDPDEIILRLKQGKIYGPERAAAAADNFFKEGNLTALREMGLRLMAQRVDQELSEFKTLQGEPLGARPHHRLIVAVFASPFSEYLIRWTRRHAYALNCPWSAVYVRTSHTLSDDEEALLRKNLGTVRELGGIAIEIQDDNVVSGILQAAIQQEATQLVVGKPRERAWWWFWKPHITHDLVYGQTNLDVHVVSPSDLNSKNFKIPKRKGWNIQFSSPSAVLNSVVVVGFATLLNLALLDYVAYHALGLIYMLAFSLASMFMKHFSVTLAATLSALLWNIVFIPPRFTFAITATEDWLMLLLYLVTAGMLGTFTRKLRRSEERLRMQGARTDALYRMTRTLAGARDGAEAIHKALEQLKIQLDVDASVWVLEGKRKIEDARKQGAFEPDTKEWAALQWAFLNRQNAGRFTDTLPALHGHYIPLLDQTGLWGVLGVNTANLKEMKTDSLSLIQAISQQLSFALGRDDLFRKLQERQIKEESEKIYKTLLNSVSHELRTPITAIQGFSGALLSRGTADIQLYECAFEISENTKRLNQVVQKFLDMGRIEAGQLKLQKQEIDLEELIRTIWAQLKPKYEGWKIKFHYPSSPVIILADAPLLSQAIENVLENAFLYNLKDVEIEVILTTDGRHARLTVADNGLGLGNHPEQVFEKFWRGNPGKTGGTGLGLSISRAFVEFHEGTLTAENVRGKGALFRFTLPLKDF
jgi:two-component system, OmpR family, sensor histidine kinase KdpD